MEASSVRTARCAQVCYLLLISLLSAMQIQLLPLVSIWNFPHLQMNRLFLITNVFYIVMQIPYGYLATVWKAQRILAFGTIFSGVMLLLSLNIDLHTNNLAIMVYFAFTGFFRAPTLPCIHALLPKLVPVSQVTGYAVATFVLRSFGVFILRMVLYQDQNNLRLTIIIVGVTSLVTGVLYFAFGRNEIHTESLVVNISNVGFRREIISFAPIEKKHDVPVLKIVTSFPVLILIVAQCCNELTAIVVTDLEQLVSFTLPYYISSPGLATFLPFLVTTVFVVIMGAITDRNMRKGNPIIRKVMAAITSLIPAAVFLVFLLIPLRADREYIRTLIILILIAKVANSAYYCSYFVNSIDLSPRNAGFIMGIANTFVTLVSMFAPKIWWLINDRVEPSLDSIGNIERSTFIGSIIFYGAGFLLFAVFGKTNVQQWDDKSLINS